MTSKNIELSYKTIEDVLNKLSTSYGRSFKEFDINNRLSNSKNKGALGNIVEEGIFGYKINSKPEADFAHLGLELKTTGIIRNKNRTIRAKERLTLESLNYFKVVEQDFKSSDLWNKIQKMILVVYEYVNELNYGDMKIINGFLHEFSEEDIKIIEQDYLQIVAKIKSGKAEEISEGDTLYLGACTAGTGQMQSQPFSSNKAKQRKFSLKNSYITQIIRRKVDFRNFERITSEIDLKTKTFEEIIESKLSVFYEKSEKEILRFFSLSTNSKSRYEMYIAKMLGVKGKVNNTDEFLKANLTLKTIRVMGNGKIKESMSFPAFTFKEIVDSEWEENDFKSLLESQKFLFAIFEEINGEYYFKRIKFWNVPIKVVEEDLYNVYSKLKEVLLSGDIVDKISTNKLGNIVYNNFPGISFNSKIHIRPHGRNFRDTFPLPKKDNKTGWTDFTKQCFWFGNGYIRDIIMFDK